MPAIFERTDGRFTARALPTADDPPTPGDALDGLAFVPFRDGNAAKHALLVAAGRNVRVNGSPVVGQIHVLEHKDEIGVGPACFYFSAESTPVVEIYHHDDSLRPPRCGTCRAPILGGPVTRCPGCSRLFHQVDAEGSKPAKPCWTYSPTCPFCGHPTSLSGESAWQPDDEIE